MLRILSLITLSAVLLEGSLEAALPDKDIDGTLFLINRTHAVSEFYSPTVRKVVGPGMSQSMRLDAAQAMEDMIAGAKADGITLSIVSGYRSYSKQSTIYARKVRNTGSTTKADELVARPGTSEHQLGLAMDLAKKGNSTLSEAFAKTTEGQWVYANCYKYGFIVRYLQGYEDVTGYNYEPWHVRYVGKDVAQAIYDSQLPMETFMSTYKLDVYDFLIYQAND